VIKKATLTIAAAGVASAALAGEGYRLIGLVLPTLDSTTIKFDFSLDGLTWSRVYEAAAEVTLGGANTGGLTTTVPPTIGALAEAGQLRLVVAAQNGGARVVTAVLDRISQ